MYLYSRACFGNTLVKTMSASFSLATTANDSSARSKRYFTKPVSSEKPGQKFTAQILRGTAIQIVRLSLHKTPPESSGPRIGIQALQLAQKQHAPNPIPCRASALQYGRRARTISLCREPSTGFLRQAWISHAALAPWSERSGPVGGHAGR